MIAFLSKSKTVSSCLYFYRPSKNGKTFSAKETEKLFAKNY